MTRNAATFTAAGLRRGAVAILPLAPGGLLFGLSLGLLAAGAGLSLGETAFMSLSVFAGASQYLAVELWREPLPIASIVLATLVVNLRHVLMGAVLAPWLRALPRRQVLPSLFLLVDENWGVTAARRQGPAGQQESDLGFLVGGGLPLYGLWTTGSLLGHAAAGLIADPRAWGLDALAGAVFLVLLLLQWRGPRCLLPWAVAAGVALAAQTVLPIAWTVLLGALAGALAGALRDGR